jgi:hypothetical protein
MQAKAPNPFWMKGNIGGRYNILGGMIKGHCDFDFEIGEQCDMPSSNPLGGMSIIADIKPVNDEDEVTVFTTPQVMFNMPVDEIIELQDENRVMHQYRIKLNHFTVKTTDGTPVAGKLIWNERNDVLIFKSKNVLPGKTTIRAAVSVRFEEYKNENWYAVMKNGTVAEETKEIVFTTGEEPDYIPQDNIAYSYPGYRAFNYYKSEADVNYVKLDFGQPKLFQPGAEWMQKARISLVSGGEVQYMDFTYDDSQCQINFSIPDNVQNNVIYRVDIVNVPVKEAQKIDENVEQQTDVVTVEADGHAADVEVTTQKAQTNRDELQEKVIYTMPFRTSRYNTFAEKLNGLSYSDGVPVEIYPLVHRLSVNMEGELFDSYEFSNESNQGLISCVPILEETDWFVTHIKPIIDLDNSSLNYIPKDAFALPPEAVVLLQVGNTELLSSDEVAAGTVNETTRASTFKNYTSKYTYEYFMSVKSELAHRYLKESKPTQALQKLYNFRYVPIQPGNYPVRFKYTLPGYTEEQSTKKQTVNFE